MPDDFQNEAVNNADVTANQGSPTEETNVSEVTEVETPDGAGETDVTTDESSAEKNWKAIREENRRLKEQLEAREPQYENIYDSFRPKAQPTTQNLVDNYTNQMPNLNSKEVGTVVNQFIDTDGNVDINGLNQALLNANRQAEEARRYAQQANETASRFEENRQTREVHEKYPQLDPNNRDIFDREAFELVKSKLLSQMYEGKPQDFMKASSEVMRLIKRDNTEAEKQKAEIKARVTEQKTQAGSVSSGNNSNRTTTSADYDELRARTRQGDKNALYERLRASGN